MKTFPNFSLGFSLKFKRAALLLGLSLLATPYAFSMGDSSAVANEGVKQMNHAQKMKRKEMHKEMHEKQMQQEEEFAPEERKLERQSLEGQKGQGSGKVQWTDDGEEDLNDL